MKDLVFIAHCLPYPPDKGEKIRALNVIKHLARDYRVHLGCLTQTTDDPGQLDALRTWCASVAGFAIDKRRQKLAALMQARPGRPLLLDYYRHSGLRRWLLNLMAHTPVEVAYVYTVAMMPYLEAARRQGCASAARVVLDAVDIDSEKWSAYAATAGFPMRHVYAREARTLLAYERHAAMASDAVLFVSPQEAARFEQLMPGCAGHLHAVENGVDLDRFSPNNAYDRPFDGQGPHLVFTGHMDYWPNADAATWFATEVMPLLRVGRPTVEFHIVGANPGPAVQRLANLPGVHVTGRVADVRPYVAHAAVCVAPLRIARGIQNKVLEAMAMARPVVASLQAFEGVRAVAGRDLLVADGAAMTAAMIAAVLDGAHPGVAAAGRRAVEAGYAWSATLARLDGIMAASDAPAMVGAPA